MTGSKTMSVAAFSLSPVQQQPQRPKENFVFPTLFVFAGILNLSESFSNKGFQNVQTFTLLLSLQVIIRFLFHQEDSKKVSKRVNPHNFKS